MGRLKLGELVGGKFVNGGRDIAVGVDCWGLVMAVYRRYGKEIPDFFVDAFAFQAINALAYKTVGTREWEEVYKPRDADAPLVVLMRMHPILITHAGVYIGNNRVIHTMKGTGVIISRADALQSRIAGYYRYVYDNQHT